MKLEELSHLGKEGGGEGNLAKMAETWGFASHSSCLFAMAQPLLLTLADCVSLAKYRPALRPSALVLDASEEGAAVNDLPTWSLDLGVSSTRRSVWSHRLGQQWSCCFGKQLGQHSDLCHPF